MPSVHPLVQEGQKNALPHVTEKQMEATTDPLYPLLQRDQGAERQPYLPPLLPLVQEEVGYPMLPPEPPLVQEKRVATPTMHLSPVLVQERNEAEPKMLLLIVDEPSVGEDSAPSTYHPLEEYSSEVL